MQKYLRRQFKKKNVKHLFARSIQRLKIYDDSAAMVNGDAVRQHFNNVTNINQSDNDMLA